MPHPLIEPTIHLAALAGLAVAAGVCVALVLTSRWHGHLTMDSMHGVQKVHQAPTPRVGGVAIVLGLLAAWLLLPGDAGKLLGQMLLAAVPALLFGLVEDVTKRVGVRDRLLATLVSGVLAWWLTGYSLTRVDVWGVDWLLAWLPLSVLFTAFAVGGAANAINIVDGMNGLAGGALTIAFAAMGAIAWQVGDVTLTSLCVVFAAVTLGFLVVNFPLGRIFLGDGGAYLMGFLMGWVAILLPMRNEAVSVWSTLMACAYPILEVGFSIWRRHRREGHHPGAPDRVHLHQLVYRRVVPLLMPHGSRPLRNGVAALVVLPFALMCGAVAVLAYGQTAVLVACFVLDVLLYRAVYFRVSQFRWCMSPATMWRQQGTEVQA